MSAFTWPPESPDGEGPKPTPTPQPVAAAVLVPIFRAEGGAHLVLTLRRSDLRRHAGEIAFPGGRRDAADPTLGDTALREAQEEIGLAPTHATPMGELPPVSTFATGYVIHPFVVSIPAGLAWTLSPREVERVLELSIEDVRAARTRTQIERRGISFETDAYVLGEHVIWGATARIVEDLLERLSESPAGELSLRPSSAA